MPYPKVAIVFCTGCRWGLRASWYAQELLQTFGDSLAEIALVPGPSGQFQVLCYASQEQEATDSGNTIWDRRRDNGFPDSKYLKQAVKATLFADSGPALGAHIARAAPAALLKAPAEPLQHCDDCVGDT
ncbi:ABR242Wp [Eremothecium gossypii ATCC 10895]|uniref:ABR242Wp n=1 Tax=Eremothecium gossypii (strain ATCC 10895 / CBS 109.51 / FGSC 9923 / NRRL Y-1056) TaxID=284811 RepID=Q75CY0_EREGS|nr:ABR242Wp [Eremothecium gossypii ATCC 10895]AAS51015.2 ABR242Wp [Eremothecium gossypii ATCC 10895]AEY95304.1 FABR242Wp [Eremothecium gossypii FDAG1]